MNIQTEIKFDHFAIATDDLEQTVQNLEKILQYPLSTGGEHKMFGTHNRLFRLSDVYLEVIAINPNATPFQQPRWFDLDNFCGKPRIITWIVNTNDILALLPNIWDNPGEIKKLSREMPSTKFIIRPHPTEEIKTWIDFANSLKNKNVKVVFTGDSVNPWLIAAKKIISHNCTTSLESVLLGNISINYLPIEGEEFEYDIPKACSYTVRDFQALRKVVLDEEKMNINYELIKYHVHNSEKRSFCDYFLEHIESAYLGDSYNEKNKYIPKYLLIFAKLYRTFRKYFSLYFGGLRRRRGIYLQKFPGFDLKTVRNIAKLFDSEDTVLVDEAWPNVYTFRKK